MSLETQVEGINPELFWILGALPLGFALDLAFGQIPGQTWIVRGLNRLILAVEESVQILVNRLGGGRGGALFGGLVLAITIVGTVASVVWICLQFADQFGGPASLAARTYWIAAGLQVRSTGDQILRAAEAAEVAEARRELAKLGGGAPPARLDELGVDRVCVAVAGEEIVAVVVSPLFWLGLGGPAALWGVVALRSLRISVRARANLNQIDARVVVLVADLAEAIPALLSWLIISGTSVVLQANAKEAVSVGWSTLWRRPVSVVAWGQAAMAGALQVWVRGGRVFEAGEDARHPQVGSAMSSPPDAASVIQAVRILQVSAVIAAGMALGCSLIW